jgi:hypothetical protein
MRPFVKIFVVLAILAALVTCIVVVAVIVLPETELVRNGLQEKLHQITGQDVRLGSIKMSGSFPKLVSLTVKDVVVTSPDGQRLLLADKVILTPELAALLKREISVESITIKGLHTSTRRAVDGTIINAFIPVPVSSPKMRISAPGEGEKGSGQDSLQTPPVSPGLKWSVNSVALEDCALDWIDQYVVAGKQTSISITHLNGFMKRQEAANGFSISLTGKISNEKEANSPFTIGGLVHLSDDLSGLQRASVSVSSESLVIDPFSPYLPPWGSAVRQLKVVAVDAKVDWEKGKPGRVLLKTESKGPLQVKANADASLAPGFAALERVNGTCEASGIPLAFMKSFVSDKLPFNLEKGTLTASLQGSRAGAGSWQVSGSAQLEGLVPVGSLTKIAPSMNLRAKGTLNPERLIIEQAELADQTTFVRLGGEVSAPLTDSRILNLQGEITVQPKWFKSFGVQLPQEIQITGPIPVHGRIKGKSNSPSLDLLADISGLRIESPYLEKTSGSKGSIGIKGKFFPWHSEHPTVSLRLQAARLGGGPHALAKAAVQMDSTILIKLNSLDLKDAVLKIKRSPDNGDLLTATGSLTNLGTADTRIECNAALTVDKETFALTGLGSDVVLGGSSVLKAKLSGTPFAMNWSVDLTANNVDLAVQKSFKKPAGVAALLKASGKWNGDTLDLTDGNLVLPGLALHARGRITDRTGQFREATLEIKRLELKDFLRLLPSVSATGLSGPLDGTIHLKNSGGHVLPYGTFHARGVDFRPSNAGLHVEKITGTLEPSGTSLTIPELKGKLTGTIEAPVKLKGKLSNVPDLSSLDGHLALQGGPGSIRAEALRKIFNQVELVGKILGPLTQQETADFLELKYLSSDINIKSGIATTDNFKIKGPALAAGAIGSLRLTSSDLDLIAAIRGATAVGTAIGKIPGVPELIKKHEGLLKATGLDKELKRFGIEVPGSDKKNGEAQNQSKATPITVILKIQGPSSGPRMIPMLESTMDKGSLTRLKSLLE